MGSCSNEVTEPGFKLGFICPDSRAHAASIITHDLIKSSQIIILNNGVFGIRASSPMFSLLFKVLNNLVCFLKLYCVSPSPERVLKCSQRVGSQDYLEPTRMCIVYTLKSINVLLSTTINNKSSKFAIQNCNFLNGG